MDKPSFSYRAREWAADNFKSVQYPDVHEEDKPKQPFFKHQMPFWKRYFLFCIGVCGLLVGLTLMVAILGFFWALITS